MQKEGRNKHTMYTVHAHFSKCSAITCVRVSSGDLDETPKITERSKDLKFSPEILEMCARGRGLNTNFDPGQPPHTAVGVVCAHWGVSVDVSERLKDAENLIRDGIRFAGLFSYPSNTLLDLTLSLSLHCHGNLECVASLCQF